MPNMLEIRGLDVHYVSPDAVVPACRNVNLDVEENSILGIAGESGSGKTTLLAAIVRLQRPPAETVAGTVTFASDAGPIDLNTADEKTLRDMRWSEFSVVFQSAMDALNPVMRLGAQFVDVLRTHDPNLSRSAAYDRAKELLSMVGISGDRIGSYPFEMSGGQRQRASIALALACKPKLVVMDEPTTAVDVVMQRTILSQVLKLKAELGFAVVFVTHDLTLLLEFADRVAIMYGGRVVEVGPAQQIYDAPLHPYTRGLRDSFPPLRSSEKQFRGIPGAPPDPRIPMPGCAFSPRCPVAIDRCTVERPELEQYPESDRSVACHLPATTRSAQ